MLPTPKATAKQRISENLADAKRSLRRVLATLENAEIEDEADLVRKCLAILSGVQP